MNVTRGLVVGLGLGAAALAGAAPAAADGPMLSGTYETIGQYGASTAHAVEHMTSDCGGCDAVATGEGEPQTILKWTGAGWSATSSAGACGMKETVVYPSNMTGIVQHYHSVTTFLTPEVCGVNKPLSGDANRISD